MSKRSQAGTRAAIYIRVSTGKQVREGESLKGQTQANRRYAEAHEFVIDPRHVYVEEGVSGRKASRPKLDAMLAAAERGEFDHIIVWKLDRLGRTSRQLQRD